MSAAQRLDLLQDRLAVVVLALVGVDLAEVDLRELRQALDDLTRRQRVVPGDRQILLARHRSSGLALGLGDAGHPTDATRAAACRIGDALPDPPRRRRGVLGQLAGE